MKTLTERHIQAIWFDNALRPAKLYTPQEVEVKVITPGEWNLEAGPDFRDAVLEIGGRRRVGDVEIHLCPADWDFHRHGSDPRYRNVIAHVTWHDGPAPKTLPPEAISLWLGRFMQSKSAFAPEQIDLTAYPYAHISDAERTRTELTAGDPEAARRLLQLAGKHRLRMKARRILGRLGARRNMRRQVFYEEVMTALGYKKNSAQFRHVSERVPLACLLRNAKIAEEALLAAGGFEDWDYESCRPSNLPKKRLVDAAHIFTSTPMIEAIDLADFSKVACRRLIAAICGRHYMGRGRAAAILCNVIVPFALAEERIASIPDWLPPEDISRPVRVMASRMFGHDHNPSRLYAQNGLAIQGLLQLYRDHALRLQLDKAASQAPTSPKIRDAPR